MKACRDRQQLGKRVRARHLARLVAVEGKSFREASEILGLSYCYIVNQLWPFAKDHYGPALDDPAEAEALAHFIVAVTKRAIVESLERMTSPNGGAAYGAVALKGLAQLAAWYGVSDKLKGESEAGSGILQSLEEIAQSVMDASPALAGKLEHLTRIRERQAMAQLPEESAGGKG